MSTYQAGFSVFESDSFRYVSFHLRRYVAGEETIGQIIIALKERSIHVCVIQLAVDVWYSQVILTNSVPRIRSPESTCKNINALLVAFELTPIPQGDPRFLLVSNLI